MFATFAKEEASFKKTLHLLPGALHKTGIGLGKLATATHVLAPTLHELEPFARALGPANEATRQARAEDHADHQEPDPPVRARNPARRQRTRPEHPERSRKRCRSSRLAFSVLNEFFNELAYNPGASKGGFLFFLDWGNHNLNSVVSTADAHGAARPQPRLLQLRNPENPQVGPAVNPNVNLLLSLLKPPSKQECVEPGHPQQKARRGAASAHAAHAAAARAVAFSSLGHERVRRQRLRCRSAPRPSATSS